MIRLTVKPGREASILRRHPWLFSGAVRSAEGDGSDGHALVVDAGGRPLARGAYSPRSQIVARLWSFQEETEPGPALFRRRFAAALRLRRDTVPSETTGLRLVNSEGDRCPGVVLDAYGGAAVLELVTEGVEKWADELEAAAREVFGPESLRVRRTGSDRDRGARPGREEGPAAAPVAAPGERVAFTENGLRFVADVARGQKTGFYLDQRENRSRLRALAGGRRVLNLFSYSGAFSVAALAAGAERAVDVDSSPAALALARENRRANALPAEDADFVRADVFEDLRRRVEAEERWDIVVSDPPALARRRSEVERAARAYKDVNRLAMRLVGSDGWFLTCSCSGLVDADLFSKIVFAASVEAGVSFRLAARQGAGPDHPVSLDCPEGEYLKGLWLTPA
jgi:23S rRNA (cytosine1962-C5)-methyltransferase